MQSYRVITQSLALLKITPTHCPGNRWDFSETGLQIKYYFCVRRGKTKRLFIWTGFTSIHSGCNQGACYCGYSSVWLCAHFNAYLYTKCVCVFRNVRHTHAQWMVNPFFLPLAVFFFYFLPGIFLFFLSLLIPHLFFTSQTRKTF